METGHLVEGLRKFERLGELKASRFYAQYGVELESLLATPQTGGMPFSSAQTPSVLRVVQWNIEKGLRFQGIAEHLATHPDLAEADVIFLNEVDVGMARTGNRHVARELAEWLNFVWAFAPAHLELTKGVGADLEADGENAEALQGNAILSRFALHDVRVAPVFDCFEPYHFHEKRYGRRVAIVATLDTEAGPLHLAGTHLEVRNTPQCRARQIRDVVEALPPTGPALVAGDFNSSTFQRGTFARTATGALRLLGDVKKLKSELRRPIDREPLFLELARGGFRHDGWNTDDVTIVEPIDSLEDAEKLPGPLARYVLKRIDRLERKLPMRLDWFAGRDVKPSDPKTISGLIDDDGRRVSDHDPIAVTVHVGGQRRGNTDTAD